MLEAKGPHFPNPLRHPDDLARLKTDVDVKVELGYVFEAITLTRHKLEGKVPLFGFAGGPWTLMAYMIEGGGSKTFSKGEGSPHTPFSCTRVSSCSTPPFSAAKAWLYLHKEKSKQLLQLLADVTANYLIGQVAAGAQILQLFESWAGELGKAQFDEFCLPYAIQILNRVKSGVQALGLDPVPMVIFAKGAHYALESLASSGFDVVGLDWTIEPREARLQTDDKVTLQGNLDPCVLYGPPEVIKNEVQK